MTYASRSAGIVLGSLALLACGDNPWFQISSDSGPDAQTSEADPGSSAGPSTTEPVDPTRPTTGGPDTTPPTTDAPGETTGRPDTTGAVDPDTTDSGDTDPATDTDTGVDTANEPCGNGVQDPGEECDDGPDNGETRACTHLCKAAACGDGFVFAGAEQCDDGPDNADTAACKSDCSLQACGDGDIGPEEECDAGAGNAWKAGGCAPGACKEISATKLFIRVTPETHAVRGDLEYGGLGTGIAGGDGTCLAAFGDKYRVLAADGETRIASEGEWTGQVDGWVLQPYRAYQNAAMKDLGVTGREALLGIQDGDKVPLQNQVIPQQTMAWTGLAPDWTTSANCEGWTVKLNNAGATGAPASLVEWFSTGGQQGCHAQLRVICVEQP